MTAIIVIGFLSIVAICVWEHKTDAGRKFRKEYDEWKNDLHK